MLISILKQQHDQTMRNTLSLDYHKIKRKIFLCTCKSRLFVIIRNTQVGIGECTCAEKFVLSFLKNVFEQILQNKVVRQVYACAELFAVNLRLRESYSCTKTIKAHAQIDCLTCDLRGRDKHELKLIIYRTINRLISCIITIKHAQTCS